MGSKGSSSRPISDEERALLSSQTVNLDLMTKIAEEQYGISKEDRAYYENVFRDGTDTQAKEALAKLQSQITGQQVDPASIKGVNIDQLLRDTILTATPEFQAAAADLVTTNQQLTAKYGTELSGLSSTFAKGVQDLTTNYSNEIANIKSQVGTINQDILSRETGAATAGLSTAFGEAKKQLESTLAQRGLGGSGVEANTLTGLYQQEALAKAGAMGQARMSALQQSEAQRAAQAQYAGQAYQAGVAGLGTSYEAQANALQNIYGVTSAADYQNYQTTQAASLQGIAGLTQLAQAGQGIYSGAQSYIAGAGTTAGNAAQIAGSTAGQIASADAAYQQSQAASSAGIGNLVGTLFGGQSTLVSKLWK